MSIVERTLADALYHRGWIDGDKESFACDPRSTEEWQAVVNLFKLLRQDADYKQAVIDRLMLEYCPDEMTPEQIKKWGKHQVVADTRKG